MAVTIDTEEHVDAPQMGGAGGGSALAATAAQARKGTKYEELFTGKARTLVKGVGHVTNGGVPLDDASHGPEILTRSRDTIVKSRAASMAGAWDTDSVIGGIRDEFWSHPAMGATKFMAQRDAQMRKNFTATNLGQSGSPYGLVPFDLLAPSRL